MRVYISGKITGTSDYIDRFEDIERQLYEEGHEVVNPARENAHLPKGTPWETYMAESLKMLCECDAIYLMDGWRESRGAVLEAMVAAYMGKEKLEPRNVSF